MELTGKHILFIVENLSVPFDKRVWRESNTLHKKGAKVSVICPMGKGYDESPYELKNGIAIFRYKLPVEGKATTTRFTIGLFLAEYCLAFLKTLLLSIKIFIKSPFQVIHSANPPDIFFLLALLFKPFGVKYVFDHHDLCPESILDKQEKPHKGFIYQSQIVLERLNFLTADIVISTNESYKKIAVERGGKAPNEVFVVRNGPDINKYKYQPNERIKNGFKYLIGYIGVMGKMDGVDYLVKAAHYIVNERNRKDILFILIGSGTAFTELKELSKKLNMDKYILFTGRIPDEEVYPILSSIDLGVAPDPPNFMNNFSTMNKIMDYMWFGKPIASFDLLETRYSAGDSALYIKEVTPESLGAGIIELLNDKQKRENMSSIGKQRVVSLTWQKSEEQLIKSYNKLFNIRSDAPKV